MAATELLPEQALRLNALRGLIAAAGSPVKFDGKTIPGFVSSITSDEIVMAGGNSNAGGFTAMIPVPDLPQEPVQGSPVEARGAAHQILTVEQINGIEWFITAGQVANEGA